MFGRCLCICLRRRFLYKSGSSCPCICLTLAISAPLPHDHTITSRDDHYTHPESQHTTSTTLTHDTQSRYTHTITFTKNISAFDVWRSCALFFSLIKWRGGLRSNLIRAYRTDIMSESYVNDMRLCFIETPPIVCTNPNRHTQNTHTPNYIPE